MEHQDQGRCGAGRTCADDLFQALRWITAKVRWSEIRWRNDCTWTPRALVWAALLWAWSDEKTVGHRFAAARKITRRGFSRQDEPAKSYQAFTKLLRKWTPTLLELLIDAFHARMRESLESVWMVAGWLVMACDGSRIDVPRASIRYAERTSSTSWTDVLLACATCTRSDGGMNGCRASRSARGMASITDNTRSTSSCCTVPVATNWGARTDRWRRNCSREMGSAMRSRACGRCRRQLPCSRMSGLSGGAWSLIPSVNRSPAMTSGSSCEPFKSRQRQGGTIVVCHRLCQCRSWRVSLHCPFRQTEDHRETEMLLSRSTGKASGTQRR